MKRYKKQDKNSYTLGITLTIELLKQYPNLVKNIYFHSKFEKSDSYFIIEKYCLRNRINIITNDKIFNILSDKENCFVIGEFEKFDKELDHDKPHIVLVNPSNSGNLGTIIRTAVGFGIDNIAIIKDAVDIFDPKTIRSTMGSLFHLKFEYFNYFNDYQNKFSNHSIYPFMLKGSRNLCEVSFKNPYSLVFGNEATGLGDEYLEYGQVVKILHTDKIDSLNLPVAVSIALYEVTKKTFLR